MHRIVSVLMTLLILNACDDLSIPAPNNPENNPTEVVSLNGTPPSNIPPTPLPEALIAEADAEFLLLSNIYDRSVPAIVHIEVAAVDSRNGESEIRSGSGFVFGMGGHIITNAHIVQDAVEITVTFSDGFVANADLVGFDTFSDLAVIQAPVTVDRLYPLALADSDIVRVGSRAITIGNSFGFNSSIYTGIISGIGRTLRSAELTEADVIPGFQNPSIIQIDRDIHQGHSGGPLLNSMGEVIGVMTSTRASRDLFEGIGFAIPSNTVRRIVPDLIEHGEVTYSWIGISVLPEENGFSVAALAQELALPVSAGVLIRGIAVDSPADKAGLQHGTEAIEVRGQMVCLGGDIVIAVNDKYIQNMDEFVNIMVMQTRPNETVNLMIIRDGETLEVPITLEERPIFSGNETKDCLS